MAENKKRTIGFFDSGAGGLSVLDCFLKNGKFSDAVYLGDNGNAPYGEKSLRELTSLAAAGVDRLRAAGAEIVVLACGTLSVNVLFRLKKIFPETPIFGVFPPIERCLLSQKRPAVLFATPRTAEKYKNMRDVSVVALPRLAKEIEDNLFSLQKVRLERHIGSADKNVAAVVLGCTHYALIGEGFARAFPHAELLFGAEDTLRAVEAYLRGCGAEKGMERKSFHYADHFMPKNRCALTTFASKTAIVPLDEEKLAKTGRFYGKSVVFIGEYSSINFQTYTNICSNFTKST
ncbi:MAG: hypothetical protein DBX59_00190 [Bacillota bacterium]|nr:MAG: hypothetical protein DBX59_00190 [Bacillota bacterium]